MNTMYASKSTLLHTALACTSPELQTMDYVIHNAYRQSLPGSAVLPTEILLIVREFLLHTVTAQLIKRSTLALVAYEQSLRDLLCPDCISYNLDIYGPDVWQWDQFNGACACIESAEMHIGSRSSTGRVKEPHILAQPQSAPGGGIVNPKQFTDSSHWLEFHLSRETARRVHSCIPGAAESRPAPPADIWRSVSSMLRDYECEAIWDPEEAAHSRSHSRIVRRPFHFQRDVIQISALRHTHAHLAGAPEWQAQATLQRAVRELGLLLDYAEEYSAYGPHVVPATYTLRWPSASNACYRGQDMVDLAKALARVLLSLTVGCVSVPITFATLAVTLFCFYSRPRGFRVF